MVLPTKIILLLYFLKLYSNQRCYFDNLPYALISRSIIFFLKKEVSLFRVYFVEYCGILRLYFRFFFLLTSLYQCVFYKNYGDILQSLGCHNVELKCLFKYIKVTKLIKHSLKKR